VTILCLQKTVVTSERGVARCKFALLLLGSSRGIPTFRKRLEYQASIL
jgi:hypothetical protein